MGGRAKISFDHTRGLPGARQAQFFFDKLDKHSAPNGAIKVERGPKENERVVQGHFRERVGESPVREEHFGTRESPVSLFCFRDIAI